MSENFGYRVIDLAGAGSAAWKELERMKAEGVCIPSNNSAMAAVARAVLAKLTEYPESEAGSFPELSEGRTWAEGREKLPDGG